MGRQQDHEHRCAAGHHPQRRGRDRRVDARWLVDRAAPRCGLDQPERLQPGRTVRLARRRRHSAGSRQPVSAREGPLEGPAGQSCDAARTLLSLKERPSEKFGISPAHPPCRGDCVRVARHIGRAIRRSAVLERATRSVDGADRALSRFVAGATADGHDLSGGFRRGGSVVQGASGRQGRRRCQDGRERALGSLGRVAGRFPGSADHVRWTARLGARHRRCVPGAARRRDGLGAAAASEGASCGKSEIERTGHGVDADTRASAAFGNAACGRAAVGSAAAGDRDRAGTAVGDLRAVVQPDDRVRTVAVGGVPAFLLPAAARLLVVAAHRNRHRLGCRHRHHERVVGRRPLGRGLGPQQRQHQRQPLQQHQRQPQDRQQ